MFPKFDLMDWRLRNVKLAHKSSTNFIIKAVFRLAAMQGVVLVLQLTNIFIDILDIYSIFVCLER